MTLLIGVVFILIVAGVVAGLVSGKIAGGLDDPTSTIPARGFEPGPVDPQSVRDLRFVPALRGYRMVQVDEALERLADELAVRDAEIARLRESLVGPGASDSVVPAQPSGDVEAAPVAEPEAAEPEAAAEPVVAAAEPEAAAEPVVAAAEPEAAAEPVATVEPEAAAAEVPAAEDAPKQS